jgi:hypothetical protein
MADDYDTTTEERRQAALRAAIDKGEVPGAKEEDEWAR